MTRSTEEEPLVEGPVIPADALHSVIRREFHTVPTHCHACLLSLLHVVYVVLSVCLAVFCVLKLGQQEVCEKILDKVSGDSVIVYGKVCLWVLVLLFAQCADRHHSRVRRRGYLHFYRKTQTLHWQPLAFLSAGNVLILLLLAARLPHPLQTYLLLSILCLEILVVVPCLCYYTVKVRQFNRARAAPDVSQEEHSHSYSNTSLTTETGFREGSSLEEVVEKQADLIEYLKQHNTLLSKRLLNLSAQH